MNEVKKPRKPLLFYYTIVLVIMLLFNLIAMPKLMSRQIKEVDYGTFMTMTENGDIGKVEVEDNQILFTNKAEDTVYKTGVLNDPGLIERLHEHGAVFSGEIVEETSPIVSFLVSWFCRLSFSTALGQFMMSRS